MADLIAVLIILVLVIVVAYIAKYLIDTFFPAPLHMPALLIVGVLLLLILLWVVVGRFGDPLAGVWRK